MLSMLPRCPALPAMVHAHAMLRISEPVRVFPALSHNHQVWTIAPTLLGLHCKSNVPWRCILPKAPGWRQSTTNLAPPRRARTAHRMRRACPLVRPRRMQTPSERCGGAGENCAPRLISFYAVSGVNSFLLRVGVEPDGDPSAGGGEPYRAGAGTLAALVVRQPP